VSGRGGEQSDDDDSENIVVKSSSGNSESKDDEEMEVSATLTAKVPLSEVRGSRTAGKNVPTSVSSTRRSGAGKQVARAPPSSASTQTTQSSDPDASAVMQVAPPQGRGKGKTVGGKRDSPLAELRRNRRTSSHDSQEGDDDADSPEVSSRSRTGHGGAYGWDVDELSISYKDVAEGRLTYHQSINTTIERQGKNEKVRFRRGDKIWILPDPKELPDSTRDMDIDDLDDDYWWVGEILDCCALDQSSQGSDNLGLLRIQWYYTGDQANQLHRLHPTLKTKLRKYTFDGPEMIRSDHLDFVGIESFAGFADGIVTFLKLKGLAVEDVERLKAPSKRKHIPEEKIPPFNLQGFSNKANAARKRKQEKLKAAREGRDVDERSTPKPRSGRSDRSQ